MSFSIVRGIPVRKPWRPALVVACLVAVVCFGRAQVDSVQSPPQHIFWVSHGRVEGHLTLDGSPAGAFSPDSAALAVLNEAKVVLMNLPDAAVEKVLRPRIPGLKSENIYSANFIGPKVLFLLGAGVIASKSRDAAEETPLLGFRWNTDQDALAGKVESIGAAGGFGPVRFLPHIGFLALYKDGNFMLWNPVAGQTLQARIPDLTRQPNLFTFSRDGHWLILAQISGSGTPDPVVVRLSERQFVNSLRGHTGTVMSVEFSPDSTKVVTACEDGKVRIYSVPDWNLLETLSGHQGPVRWAEFSPDSLWVASTGEDQTVRVWSVADGKLVQTLSESREPLATVAFSPDGRYLAASSQQTVLVWQRTAGPG